VDFTDLLELLPSQSSDTEIEEKDELRTNDFEKSDQELKELVKESNKPSKKQKTKHSTKRMKKSKNPFIQKYLLTEERGRGDDFSDLEDFIVVKKSDII
jgi:hypothetical protein